MVKAKSYTPTNKRFKRHFQDIAETKARKGHLNQGEREQEDVITEKGILVRIEKAKINDNGWEVEVVTGDNKKTYNCVNSTGAILQIPECIESDKYYTPKHKTSVDVLIDNVSKLYSITRIRSLDKTMMVDSDSITIGYNNNSDNEEEYAQILLSLQNVKINKTVQVDGDIEAENITQLEEKVRDLENIIKAVIQRD